MALTSDQIATAGATVISNPLSTEFIQPTETLRQPSVRYYVANAFVVDSSAPTAAPPEPATDPLCVALKAVDGLSTMYMAVGPVTMPLIVLQDALADAVACCDDAIDEPPADLPSLGNDSLGNALKYLGGISNMYRKFGTASNLMGQTKGRSYKCYTCFLTYRTYNIILCSKLLR